MSVWRTFELRKGVEHRKRRHALSRRADGLGEATKADAAQPQFLDGLDELFHRTRCQTVELPNNERVAAAGVLQRFKQRGTIRHGS